jgi:hypothetical protein
MEKTQKPVNRSTPFQKDIWRGAKQRAKKLKKGGITIEKTLSKKKTSYWKQDSKKGNFKRELIELWNLLPQSHNYIAAVEHDLDCPRINGG